jgi:hypothetical protein
MACAPSPNNYGAFPRVLAVATTLFCDQQILLPITENVGSRSAYGPLVESSGLFARGSLPLVASIAEQLCATLA